MAAMSRRTMIMDPILKDRRRYQPTAMSIRGRAARPNSPLLGVPPKTCPRSDFGRGGGFFRPTVGPADRSAVSVAMPHHAATTAPRAINKTSSDTPAIRYPRSALSIASINLPHAIAIFVPRSIATTTSPSGTRPGQWLHGDSAIARAAPNKIGQSAFHITTGARGSGSIPRGKADHSKNARLDNRTAQHRGSRHRRCPICQRHPEMKRHKACLHPEASDQRRQVSGRAEATSATLRRHLGSRDCDPEVLRRASRRPLAATIPPAARPRYRSRRRAMHETFRGGGRRVRGGSHVVWRSRDKPMNS